MSHESGWRVAFRNEDRRLTNRASPKTTNPDAPWEPQLPVVRRALAGVAI